MGNAKKVTFQLEMVTLKTRLEVAVDKETSGFHAVCVGTEDQPHDPVRVKQSTSCPTCEITHSSHYGFPERGVERDGKMVIVPKDKLAEASGKAITGNTDKGDDPVVIDFRPREKVYASTLPSEGVHYMSPEKGFEQAYALLVAGLKERADKAAVVLWAPSSKNALWVLEVVGDGVITLQKRCYPEQVRTMPMIPKVDPDPKQVKLFGQLIDASTEDFDPLEYINTAKQGVEELIAAHVGEATPIAAEVGAPAGDLLSALQASVDAAKKKTAPRAVKKAPAKKVAAKKTAAKKTPAA